MKLLEKFLNIFLKMLKFFKLASKNQDRIISAHVLL